MRNLCDIAHTNASHMPVPFIIPKRLERFAPVLEWISNIPAEELDTYPDMSYLDSFLRSLYGGLPFEDADKRMESDRRELGKLVEIRGEKHPWLYFLQAYLTPHILPYLLEEDAKDEREEPPPLTLHVKLPDELHVTNDYGSVLVSNSSADISLVPTAESVLEFKLKNLRDQAQHWAEVSDRPDSRLRIEYSFSQVYWEAVSGWKVIEQQRSPATGKCVMYLLKVPGGASIVEVHCKDVDFDERKIEKYLRTINVQTASLD